MVEMDDHRSHVLTPDDLDWADVVLLFDGYNDDRLRTGYPDHASKLHFVGDLLASGETEIADPFGRGDPAYHEAYRRIARAIDAIAPKEKGRVTR